MRDSDVSHTKHCPDSLKTASRRNRDRHPGMGKLKFQNVTHSFQCNDKMERQNPLEQVYILKCTLHITV